MPHSTFLSLSFNSKYKSGITYHWKVPSCGSFLSLQSTFPLHSTFFSPSLSIQSSPFFLSPHFLPSVNVRPGPNIVHNHYSSTAADSAVQRCLSLISTTRQSIFLHISLFISFNSKFSVFPLSPHFLPSVNVRPGAQYSPPPPFSYLLQRCISSLSTWFFYFYNPPIHISPAWFYLPI